MPESLLIRWLTFETKPKLLEESYGKVMLRIGILLFAALLFRLILVGSELEGIWAVIVFVFSLLVCLLLIIGLSFLTRISGTARLSVFGLVMALMAAAVIILSVFLA